MSRKRLVWGGIAAFVTVVAVVVLTVFQPQKLFYDDRVDEAAPAGASAVPLLPQSAAASAETLPAEPVPIGASTAPAATSSAPAAAAVAQPRQGMFRSLDHKGTGTAKLLMTGDTYVVRFEDFNVENGPDLYVYLSPATSDSKESAFDKAPLSLGRLKGNVGNQNYEVPAGTDISKYKSVVIWCKRFSSGFAVAPLV